MLVCLSACASVQALQADLTKDQTSLWYIHDSAPVDCKLNVSITVNVNTGKLLSQDTTTVVKDHFWCVPLLFVNVWDAKIYCHAGQDFVADDVVQFVSQSFHEEVERYCVLALNDSIEANLRLDISVDSISTVEPSSIIKKQRSV